MISCQISTIETQFCVKRARLTSKENVDVMTFMTIVKPDDKLLRIPITVIL